MLPTQITLLNFSPAGHTKTALWAVARAWTPIAIREIDLLPPKTAVQDYTFTDRELCILGVPSYGGRMPAAAVEKLKPLNGQNTPLVNLVSYGNRHFDDTLAEMQDIMEHRGFNTVAGIAAIAEHTICPNYATGRPNRQDKEELQNFGSRIRSRMLTHGPAHVDMPGNRPYRTFAGIPMHPQPNQNCTHCGLCAAICPAEAIQPPDFKADAKRCFTCMRCVYFCSEHARQLPEDFVKAVAHKLEPACTQNRPNQLFL